METFHLLSAGIAQVFQWQDLLAMLIGLVIGMAVSVMPGLGLVMGVVLALPGAFLGALVAWVLFNGNVVDVQGLIFKLTVTPHLLVVSIFWALFIGLIGASLPALRAARLPVATALRAT